MTIKYFCTQLIFECFFLFYLPKSYIKMYKINYHPWVILIYTSGMLDTKQPCELPKTTKYNWNQFKDENYYGNDWVSSCVKQFDNIKDIFASSFLYKSMRFLIKTTKGYLFYVKIFC